MMLDESGDQSIRLVTSRAHAFERVIAAAGRAAIRLLIRVQLGIDEEAVFEIVDTDLGRLPIGDGAQMTRDFQATLVCLLDRGTQFRAREMCVDLEGGHAPLRPISHGLTSILRTAEFLHLELLIPRPIYIVAVTVQLRPRNN